MRKFKHKLLKPEAGFTMIEVLLAILTVTFFLAGTLQLIAIDTFYKMKSKQVAQAAFWIQEDLEEIRAMAADRTPALWSGASCNPGTTVGSTYARVLQNNITARDSNTDAAQRLPGSDPKPLLSPNGKLYQMTRTYSITGYTDSATIKQPTVLKINYLVEDINAKNNTNKDINKDPRIATQYAEVIPYVSFENCN